MISLTSFCCFYHWLWTYFTPFSSVSIVDFKQVNVSWEVHWIQGHWIQDFFSTLLTKYFSVLLDFEIVFSILKYFSGFRNIFLDSEIFFSILNLFSRFHNFFWLWNIFLDSKIFFSILKVFFRLWKFFFDFESFFSMAAIGHHGFTQFMARIC